MKLTALATKKVCKDRKYQVFCRQMYHACLARVFQPLKAGMTIPEVVKCPDGHFRQAAYGLGPYIINYPEQVWLAAIVQGWCPKWAPLLYLALALASLKPCTDVMQNLTIWMWAMHVCGIIERLNFLLIHGICTPYGLTSMFMQILWWVSAVIHHQLSELKYTAIYLQLPLCWYSIHQLLSPDLLHQVIKGTFKDHIVLWVNMYLLEEHGEARGLEIIVDIDHQ